MHRSCISVLLAAMVGLVGLTQAVGGPLCKPTLAFKGVRFSPMRPPTMERKWTATVTVDASRCVANSAGYFEILFSRLKETGPDIDFRVEFMWFASEWVPPLKVEVDFWADEAVDGFWFDNITRCPCAR